MSILLIKSVCMCAEGGRGGEWGGGHWALIGAY